MFTVPKMVVIPSEARNPALLRKQCKTGIAEESAEAS